MKILFKHAHTSENLITMEKREIKIKNLVTKNRLSAQ